MLEEEERYFSALRQPLIVIISSRSILVEV